MNTLKMGMRLASLVAEGGKTRVAIRAGTPGAVLDLTLFAYACEAFVGVAPSVALFRHFFYPRACKEGWMGGGVTFCFRPNIKAAGYPEINIKSKWEEWRAGWFLVEVPAPSPLFDEPTKVATDQPSWKTA